MPNIKRKSLRVADLNHEKLVNDVLSLNKRSHLEKPSRTEPTLEITEFNLVKSVTGTHGTVHVSDLTNVLNKRAKHVEIAKKIASSNRKGKTLPKPLEKPRADRIRRTVAFEKVKKQLNRWDAVVTSNRVSNSLSFPLPSYNFDKEKRTVGYRLKTDLQKELEALKPDVEIFNLEQQSKYPLTMQEMMERRKETAKMRAVQSYKEAKARRLSKIKSKKYHRIQRKENVKKQIKEFELLQKTNPEEALKKLEEIERVRVEERASLRHRSTGKWAKNKQVQAKYDKDSRQALAQQLTISRDLTQKLKIEDSDTDDETVRESLVAVDKNEDNPWTNSSKTNSEMEHFLSGYRKFWQNENEKQEAKEIPKVSNKSIPKTVIITKQDDIVKAPEKQTHPHVGTSDWDISLISGDSSNSDEENKIIPPIRVKRTIKERPKEIKKKKKTKAVDLSFPVNIKHPIVNDPLFESSYNDESNKNNLATLEAIIKNSESIVEEKSAPTTTTNIDPNNIIKTKMVNLNTEIPDLLVGDDDEEGLDQRGTITEAFQDDDIIGDFRKEKKAEINNEKPKDINLTLPGWGSWGGTGIKGSKRKNRRFIVKFPKKFKRRDDNKGNLIINEKGNAKIKTHLVSEVPFPFKTVKDFEASIRAPISNTFVPETAYRKMIRPSIKTKMGSIIEPMTEDVLLNKKKSK